MKQKFIEWNPSKKSKVLLEQILLILADYKKQGYKLTLRQLYYQLVSKDIIPNKVSEYTKLGNIVSKGRLSGWIDWDMIEDRTRQPKKNAHWDSPKQILETASRSYYRDRWKGQEFHVEVWCEKDAVSNIIEPVTKKWDVLFMANRGYSSQSAMYVAYKRMLTAMRNNKEPIVLYLGDHDPSGIDMVNDIDYRLGLMLYGEDHGFRSIKRIALNMDQIDMYRPPENPAKATDSRFRKYSDEFGFSSWELDALEPAVLSDIVNRHIQDYLDLSLYDAVEELETKHKSQLWDLIDNAEFE